MNKLNELAIQLSSIGESTLEGIKSQLEYWQVKLTDDELYALLKEVTKLNDAYNEYVEWNCYSY